jgi:hypothetical protein
VADYLENEGVQRGLERIIWDARTPEASDIFQQCQLLADKDFLPPDGVPGGQNGHVEALREGPFMVVPTPSYGQLLRPSPPSATGY